jgi:hypothetical protein
LTVEKGVLKQKLFIVGENRQIFNIWQGPFPAEV